MSSVAINDQDMQEYFQLFCKQMGPEIEQKIQTNVERRYHDILTELTDKIKELNAKLNKEQNKQLQRKVSLDREIPELTEELERQCYHMFAMQMGPEMEKKIEDRVEERTKDIFATHQQEIKELQNKLEIELEKNKTLNEKLARAQEESRYLFKQVEEIYKSIIIEGNKAGAQENRCVIS